jgi:tetratricopeptide (TPR) repeat protein
MTLWYNRILALFKLNEFDALEYEFKNLGDLNRESLCYENCKNTELTGPIIPFQISLMYCRVPLLKQNYTEAVERFYTLLYSLKYKDKSWEILVHIGTALLKMEDYFLSTEIFKCVSEAFDDMDPQKLEFDSIRGRIFLKLGDLETASQIFDQVSKKSESNSRLVHMNNALLAISKGEWENATAEFSKILDFSPNDWATCNNIAIIELYKGQISEALSRLDQLLENNPKEMARSSEAIFNLSTVYDLIDQSLERKKKVLANVITPFAGDNFQITSLKL